MVLRLCIGIRPHPVGAGKARLVGPGPPVPRALRVGSWCQAHQPEPFCTDGARNGAAGFELWVWYLGPVTTSVPASVSFRVRRR